MYGKMVKDGIEAVCHRNSSKKGLLSINSKLRRDQPLLHIFRALFYKVRFGEAASDIKHYSF